MKLTEMLEYTAAQYLDDRTELVDGDPDALWSDSFLVRQFNEAQRLLARASWCIVDEANATAGNIVLATGVAVYALHKSVLRVIFATPADQTWPLRRTNDAMLRGRMRPADDMPFDIDTTGSVQTGRPIAIATDAGTRQVRIYRTPTVTENGLVINLKVARLPVTWLELGSDVAPEVPEDYHELLCRYAAGMALTQPNVDGQMKTDGRALIARFNDDLRDARRDRQRAGMDAALWNFVSDTAGL